MPTPTASTSAEIRSKMVDALKLDLVGPWPGHPFASELLPENPNRWYLTGYLVPETAPVQHRSDAEAKDEVDAGAKVAARTTAERLTKRLRPACCRVRWA